MDELTGNGNQAENGAEKQNPEAIRDGLRFACSVENLSQEMQLIKKMIEDQNKTSSENLISVINLPETFSDFRLCFCQVD